MENMKRLSATICVICLLFPIITQAKEFAIRNGIKWGMDFDTVINLMSEEGYSSHETLGEDTFANGLHSLLYRDVIVAGSKFNALYIFAPDETRFERSGLVIVIYFSPGYSMLMSHKMLDDYDMLFEGLKKKYGNPTRKNAGWENNDHKKLYTEATAAHKGLYYRYAAWEKRKDVFIELMINDNLVHMLEGEKELVLGPTVWVGYYCQEVITALKNQEKQDSNYGL